MTDEKERWLIHDYLGGEATDEDCRRLEEWMKEDTSHVDLFVREAFLHHRLHEVLRDQVAAAPPLDAGGELTFGGANESDGASGLLPDADGQSGSSVFYIWSRGIRPWVIPIFGLLLGLGIGAWLFHDRQQGGAKPGGPIAASAPLAGPNAPSQEASQSVATVEEVTPCVWAKSATGASGPGTRVAPGHVLNLTSGTANVNFDCGATVTLKGPASLVVDTPMDATLLRGDLLANVPDKAFGFLVHTNEMDVRDLGTKFKLNVDGEGQTSVEVVDGEVEAKLAEGELAPRSKHSLSLGEFLRTGRGSSDPESDSGYLSVFRGVRVDFSVPETLGLLTVMGENKEHYRHDPRSGCLSIDTTWGNVFGPGEDQPGENLFLLPAPEKADFDVVLSVVSFVPERFCEHLGLLIMDNYDNYARMIYAFNRIRLHRYVQFNVESNGNVGSKVARPVDFGTGPFQLRLVRRGSEISGWWSTDGRRWHLRDRGTAPPVIRYVGFYASKGHPYPKNGTPYRQALIDKLEIEVRDTGRSGR